MVGPSCLQPSCRRPLPWPCQSSGRGSRRHTCGEVWRAQRGWKTWLLGPTRLGHRSAWTFPSPKRRLERTIRSMAAGNREAHEVQCRTDAVPVQPTVQYIQYSTVQHSTLWHCKPPSLGHTRESTAEGHKQYSHHSTAPCQRLARERNGWSIPTAQLSSLQHGNTNQSTSLSQRSSTCVYGS